VAPAHAQAPAFLVRDIKSVPGGLVTVPVALVQSGTTVYFAASTPQTGSELWKSDGTQSGTALVKDIRPGPDASFLTPPVVNYRPELVDVNGTLFFRANDGTTGFELWKSDGTEAGTVRVKDINPGGASSSILSLVNKSGTLFFLVEDHHLGSSGLWKSDGTEAGTVQVTGASTIGGLISGLFVDGSGTLFFTVGHPIGSPNELWKSDGTEAGTLRVKTFGQGSVYVASFVDVGGTLFFVADDGPSGEELWKSDGTEAGTLRVADIRPGRGASFIGWPVDVGGTLFFTADDGVTGIELWKSDGTEAGTLRVRDIWPGPRPRALSQDFAPHSLVDVNGTLFLVANDGVVGLELWKSDGTEAGTVLVKDIYSGASVVSYPVSLVDVNGELYFAANDGVTGYELWRSDGTESGTVRVKDIHLGSGGSSPAELVDVNGTLFFRAYDGASDAQLWKSDGTDAVSVPIAHWY
jgi:ELWxxDGT repeat protein